MYSLLSEEALSFWSVSGPYPVMGWVGVFLSLNKIPSVFEFKEVDRKNMLFEN